MRELNSRWFFRIIILTGVYYLAGKFGLSLASINASASAVWPPTGIALASLLLWGLETWPAVFLGAFLVNITTQGSFFTSLGIAGGNCLEALLGAWLVRRFAGGVNAFGRAQDTLKFMGLAGIVSTVPSSTFGVTSLCFSGLARWVQYPAIWLTWWLGDMVSNLIIAPLVIIWTTRGLPRLISKQIVEAALMLVTVIVTGCLLFLGKTVWSAEHEPLGFLALPPLLWAAFRFGRRGAITAALMMSGIALWGTVHRFGPFVGSAVNASLLFAQAFMGISTLTALVLAVLLAERKEAEAILKESEARFRAFFDNAVVGAVQLNSEARIVVVNDSFCQITGYGRAELVGMHPSDLDHPEEKDTDRRRVTDFLAGKIPKYDVEKRYVRKSGEVIWVHVTVGIIRDGNGRIVRTASIVEDITARRAAEEALTRTGDELARVNSDLETRVGERTAKLREMITELEHFSYALVHDLRAPLRAMQSFAGLAEQELGEQAPPAVADYLQRIRAASGRMDGLVLDALNYNRAVLQDLPLVPVDLYELVSGIIATYPNLQPPTAQVQIEGRLPVVLGNKAGLTQCFSNLLGNAVKFVASGTQARVRIWTENGAFPKEKHASNGASNGAVVRIWIEDNGIGIAKESQGRIFDMFQRAHPGYEGTGAGLAIVRKVAKRMSGQVGVESEPGKGSRFWLELPVAAHE